MIISACTFSDLQGAWTAPSGDDVYPVATAPALSLHRDMPARCVLEPSIALPVLRLGRLCVCNIDIAAVGSRNSEAGVVLSPGQTNVLTALAGQIAWGDICDDIPQ